MSSDFQALVLDQENNMTKAGIRRLSLKDLPDQDVLVRVHFSTLNYKDALAITGRGKVIRKFPMVPGIDLAGEVVEAGGSPYQTGDYVISTGWGVGEEHWGGLAEYARLAPEWPLPLPDDLDMRSAMIMGTGGLTAALSVLAIAKHGLKPEDGPVLVTGAGGGVGGVAVMLLSRLGYEVHAVSGRESLNDYLRSIGAARTLPRDELARDSKPLEKAAWAAAVDAVGDSTLATALAGIRPEGIIAACGNAGGIQLRTTVFPFILRGVTLRGINSVTVPRQLREEAWGLIADNIPPEYYDLLTDREITLGQVEETCQDLLAGKIRGRVIVNLQP